MGMHNTAHLVFKREVWGLLADLHGGPDAEARYPRALGAERRTRWPVQLPCGQCAYVHVNYSATVVGPYQTTASCTKRQLHFFFAAWLAF